MINLNTKSYIKIVLLLIITATLQGCGSFEYTPIHNTICIGDALEEAEFISIEFWGDSTDMQHHGEMALNNAIRNYKHNPRLSFQIQGKSSFSIESDDIGLRRADTLVAYLIEAGVDHRDIKILSLKGRGCLLIISKNTTWGMNVCKEDSTIIFKNPSNYDTYACPNCNKCELISVCFENDSTDMQCSGKSAIDDTILEFKSNPRLRFKIEGKASWDRNNDMGLPRAETLRCYLINEGISSSNIKILSSRGSECLLSITS